ncbi:hypothetical protein [Bacillus suaedaesalsae]|uniref:ABC transmembrane type-1 domain-containing protein n=1 Tax=Bacillus suaedaesalsae TaxID=2810349 RepID=A0ABS2DKH2_9BACI|nr:hypothetical protein [Bacillus suaedaesalsae]MBM6618901.1 hypothetical protein [Bacillus suaedaesalsae]
MRMILNFILTIFGFLLISALPALIFSEERIGIFIKQYGQTMYFTLQNLFQPDKWQFLGSQSFGAQKVYPLFPMLWERYLYSMTVFAVSLVIAIAVAYVFMIIVHIVPKKMKSVLVSISSVIEALPDAFIIVSIQLLIIGIFKKTNVLIAQIAVFNSDIYAVPIFCLSIIPTFLLFKTILFLIDEEKSKLYIDLARVKGLSGLKILLVHTFRNVLYSLFYRAKLIFAFMLSNLFIIEVIFNMNGAMQFLLSARGAEFIVGATLIFTPFFIFFSLAEKVMLQQTGESRDIA